MKKIKVMSIAIILCFGIVGAASAVTITSGPFNGQNAGAIDDLLGTTNSLDNSNPDTETAWVNEVLGDLEPPESATFQVKSPENIDYYSTDQSTFNTDGSALGGVWAFGKMSPPPSEFFLIKNATYWALYRNFDDMAWGVFDTDLLPSDMNLPSSDWTISHVTRFNPQGVPEPATMLLLGTGLFGLAVIRRRFKK